MAVSSWSNCRVKASGTTLSRPGTCAISVANSLIKALMSLTIRYGVLSFQEGARKRSLIRKDPETPSFQHVSKFHHCSVNGEQLQVIRLASCLGGSRSPAEETERLKFTINNLVYRSCDGPSAGVRVDTKLGVSDWMKQKRGLGQLLY